MIVSSHNNSKINNSVFDKDDIFVLQKLPAHVKPNYWSRDINLVMKLIDIFVFFVREYYIESMPDAHRVHSVLIRGLRLTLYALSQMKATVLRIEERLVKVLQYLYTTTLKRIMGDLPESMVKSALSIGQKRVVGAIYAAG